MERDRSYRRHQVARAKAQALRIALRWGMDRGRWINSTWPEIRPVWVGKMAAVHCKPCSCTGCGNPRRHFGTRTIQEQKWALTCAEEELSWET